MKIPFSKYQATGNDFILLDNRKGNLKLSRAEIAQLCHRKFGVGADGLILLNPHANYDFEMKNYNSDGGECSMCGNGGRSLIQFASDLGMKKAHYRFIAIDGEHEARIENEQIALKMGDVQALTPTPVGISLDTGSPHLIIEVDDLLEVDVVNEGRHLRNHSLFHPSGINVNFIEHKKGEIFIRTYERGVEDETLSCGTGAIAAALTCSLSKSISGHSESTPVQCQGGRLEIRFERVNETHFKNIWLIGPAVKVFEGML